MRSACMIDVIYGTSPQKLSAEGMLKSCKIFGRRAELMGRVFQRKEALNKITELIHAQFKKAAG